MGMSILTRWCRGCGRWWAAIVLWVDLKRHCYGIADLGRRAAPISQLLRASFVCNEFVRIRLSVDKNGLNNMSLELFGKKCWQNGFCGCSTKEELSNQGLRLTNPSVIFRKHVHNGMWWDQADSQELQNLPISLNCPGRSVMAASSFSLLIMSHL